ncbi:MAG: hypothetical protein HYX40_09140 [Sphingobacteriales bacterium]|nr:hypothetical protein [Sphingobacteriales bacterium]
MFLFIILFVQNVVYSQHANNNASINCFQNISLIKQGDHVIVSWTINSFLQDGYYEIERAERNMIFKTVGILFPDNKISSSDSFIFKDKILKHGKNSTFYYRIKQIKPDGKMILSFIKSLTVEALFRNGLPVFNITSIKDYTYYEKKHFLMDENNNNVAGILRNIFVSINKKYSIST